MSTKKKPAATKKPIAKKAAAPKVQAKKPAAKPAKAKIVAKPAKSVVAKKPVAKKLPLAKKPAAKVTAKPKKSVSFVPKGYTSITPYLIMPDARKAIDFYSKVFGAKLVMKMDKPGGKIGHAELKIGDAKIMLADEYPEMGARSPKAFGGSAVGIQFYTKNVDNVVNNAVSSGAKLLMPVQDMFYGDRCGSIEDPFGHKWHISTHIEDVSPATLKKRAAEMEKYKA